MPNPEDNPDDAEIENFDAFRDRAIQKGHNVLEVNILGNIHSGDEEASAGIRSAFEIDDHKTPHDTDDDTIVRVYNDTTDMDVGLSLNISTDEISGLEEWDDALLAFYQGVKADEGDPLNVVGGTAYIAKSRKFVDETEAPRSSETVDVSGHSLTIDPFEANVTVYKPLLPKP